MAVAAGVILLLLVLLGIVLKLITTSWNSRGHKEKPPQPPSWPIIGHLHLLIKSQPRHRTLGLLSQSYGPIIHLRLGSRPVLLITSPVLAKECFTTNDRLFASRPRLVAGEHLGFDNAMIGSAPYGPIWRILRKICTLELLSARRIQLFHHIRTEEISSLVRSLFHSCHGQANAETVNMKSRLSELTFNIIVRMVTKRKYSGSHQSEEFRKLIKESFLLHGSFNVGDYLPFLKWFDLQGYQRAMKKLQKRRDAFMQVLVDEHRQRRRVQGRGDVEDADLIDVLLSVTENDQTFNSINNNDIMVKATALNMITAGTDTSALTTEWALAALLQHPHMLKKAQQELDTRIGRDRVVEESDLPELKYLEAIVKETLRLYPVAPLLVPHESTEPCTVGGYNVPAGTRLLVNAWAIHRDPAVWERPTEFDPERFLKGQREINVNGQDFELIPFGSGRRACPAISLALRVVQHTLARLLHSFEWFVPFGSTVDMSEGLGLTMPKAIPLEALINPRLPLHLY